MRLEIMKLFVTYLTHLLPTAGLEDLVDDSQMLVEVGNLLAALGAAVSLPLVHHLNMGIMVGLLISLVFTVRALVLKSCSGGCFKNLKKIRS